MFYTVTIHYVLRVPLSHYGLHIGPALKTSLSANCGIINSWCHGHPEKGHIWQKKLSMIYCFIFQTNVNLRVWSTDVEWILQRCSQSHRNSVDAAKWRGASKICFQSRIRPISIRRGTHEFLSISRSVAEQDAVMLGSGVVAEASLVERRAPDSAHQVATDRRLEFRSRRRSRVEKDRRTACRSIPLHFWTGKTRSGEGSDQAKRGRYAGASRPGNATCY